MPMNPGTKPSKPRYDERERISIKHANKILGHHHQNGSNYLESLKMQRWDIQSQILHLPIAAQLEGPSSPPVCPRRELTQGWPLCPVCTQDWASNLEPHTWIFILIDLEKLTTTIVLSLLPCHWSEGHPLGRAHGILGCLSKWEAGATSRRWNQMCTGLWKWRG